jgi:hypothetical protein
LGWADDYGGGAVIMGDLIAFPFDARRWLAAYEAAGGRLLIVGSAVATNSPTRRAERLVARLFSNRRRWVAVYQLAAALGPCPQGKPA